jgi:hypothetical protein
MMPYIKEDNRKEFNFQLEEIAKSIKTHEELSYVIAKIVYNYINLYSLDRSEKTKKDVESMFHANLKYYFKAINQVEDPVWLTIPALCEKFIETAGNYNYAITFLIHAFILKEGLRYKVINRIIGMLEGIIRVFSGQMIALGSDYIYISETVLGMLRCVQLEVYRIVSADYEDVKMLENGNISKLDSSYYLKSWRIKNEYT